MKLGKRLLTMLLAFTMIVTCVMPGIVPRAKAAISYDTYYTNFQNFINDERFNNGTYWNGDQREFSEFSSWQSWGCCAYAATFAGYVYGSRYAWSSGDFTEYYNMAEIRTGDIIHYYRSDGGEHWFVVLERNGDQLYTAEGNAAYEGVPSVYVSRDIRYLENGQLKSRWSSKDNYITSFVGYHYNFTNSASAYQYKQTCERFTTRGFITVTKDGANINDRPCSKKTMDDMVTIAKGALNQTYNVSAVYKNTEGNYWYEIDSVSGQLGYIYAENCKYTPNCDDVAYHNANIPTTVPANGSVNLGGTVSSGGSKIHSVTVTLYQENGKKYASKTINSTNNAVDMSGFSFALSLGQPTTLTCTVSADAGYYDINKGAYAKQTKKLYEGAITLTCANHTYGSWKTVQAASCTADGSKSRTCSACGATESQTIPATGHSFGGWYVSQAATCTVNGTKTRNCTVCGSAENDVIPATDHSWTKQSSSGITCTTPAYVNYICLNCNETKSEKGEVTWSEWSEEYPQDEAQDRIETKTQYRYRELDSNWQAVQNGTVEYVASWPGGFDTGNSYYAAYNKTPMAASETADQRVSIVSDDVVGYLYYHWCRGRQLEQLYNSAISDVYTNTFWAFHAYYSTYDVGFNSSANAWNAGNWDCCHDTYWYFQIPVRRQSYVIENKAFDGERWGAWSQWTDAEVIPSESREVETREVYRYVTDGLADHVWDAGVVTKEPTETEAGETVYTCTVCGGKKIKTGSASGGTVCWVTYDANGGAGAPDAEKVSAGTDFTPSSVIPTRAGYQFAGWYDDAAVDARGIPVGKKYASPQKIIENITLYAIWIDEAFRPYGDLNQDGKTNISDIVLLNKSIDNGQPPAGTDEELFVMMADLNRDGKLTAADTELLNDLVVGNVNQLDVHKAYIDTKILEYPKTVYQAGESLDTTGLVIQIEFEGDISYQLSDGLTVTGFEPNNVGTQTLTVAYHQFATTYEIEVKSLNTDVTEPSEPDNECSHSTVYVNGSVEADCTKNGYTGDLLCIYCDKLMKKGTVILPLGHEYENGICIRCGKPQSAEPEKPVTPNVEGVTRLAGNSRYETSFAIANEMKKALGITKFDSIILANSDNFADALAGSYLAAVKKAPIIIAKPKYAGIVCEYLNANLAEGGTIYILGGTVAMPDSILADMAIDYVPQRLAGENRYDTNLAILGEAGVSGKDILVATGQDFADSLSASATGLPILLVNGKPGKTLSEAQKDFLAGVTGKIYIIGGESAVPKSMVDQIEAASGKETERIAGGSRYETSVKIAEKFLGDATSGVVAYASTFPDGLCGGALAYVTKSPLILCKNGKTEAPAYAEAAGIRSGYVLGSGELISDGFAKSIFQVAEILK